MSSRIPEDEWTTVSWNCSPRIEAGQQKGVKDRCAGIQLLRYCTSILLLDGTRTAMLGSFGCLQVAIDYKSWCGILQ
ncbi:hypothetical protein IAQ61_000606 [Plenodomus lingam]|uniref:uncharacterized protein n=1 Tax=Leptosphaeria maculans TaxID=5022 RepID=UPI00331BE617|nr:hypothetical protein IAQ61_000606 [Plenodomus lingam]